MQVTREGRVIVRAPLRLAKCIERFVAEHMDGISALADQQSRRAAHPELMRPSRLSLSAERRGALPKYSITQN
ncbi:MAG: hypothetical protein ACLT4C_04235 [Butyricicoccus sp.]